MTAAAAMASATAAAGFEIAGFRDMAEFETFADVLGDGLLDALHFILGVEKTAGDGVLEKGFTMLLEIVDFSFFQRQAVMAFLLEEIAFGDQGIVLAAGGVVGDEGVDFQTQGFDFRLIKNGLAEFPGFLDDHCFFGLSLHNIVCPRFAD